MPLHEYQKKNFDEIMEAFASPKIRGVALVSPTGSGKTHTMAEVIKLFSNLGTVLVLTHKKDLIAQLGKNLFQNHGIMSGIIKSGVRPMPHLPVQIASVQTVYSRRHIIPNVVLVVADEGHHVMASTWLKSLGNYPNAKFLLVTATLIRSDGQGFSDVCQKIVLGPSVRELEKMGFLCPAEYYFLPMKKEQIERLKVHRHEYDNRSLNEVMNTREMTANLVKQYLEKGEGMQMISFLVNIKHADNVARAFNEAGVPAASIHSEMHNNNRQNEVIQNRIIDLYRAEKIKVLANVGLLTEGSDLPNTRITQLGRPTKSMALYFQMVGRAIRTCKGKDKFLVFDHGNNLVEHGRHDWEVNWSLEGRKDLEKRAKDRQQTIPDTHKKSFFYQNSKGKIKKHKIGNPLNESEEIRLLEPTEYKQHLLNLAIDIAQKNNWTMEDAYHQYQDFLIKELNEVPTRKDLEGWVHQGIFDKDWINRTLQILAEIKKLL